jgi:DNA-binding response OmpR family regulator
VPRILVVDDEANARNALLEILADEGYVVDSAIDGEAGCARLAAFLPDLVLTDVHMPRMDGLALMQAARATRKVPAVVLMSAHRPAADAPFVHKPIDVDELLATVQATLAARRRR